MKYYLHKFALIALLALSGFGIAYPAAPEKAADNRAQPQIINEKDAINALTKLGIPIQKDLRGAARWIEATKGEFTDSAMAYLPSLPNLEWLEIGGGNVTPSGTAYLSQCPSLKRLYIHDIQLAGDNLKWLSSLNRLEALSLQRTGINGSMLKTLASINTLTVLNLSGNPITDDAVESIAHIKGLEVLGLASTKVTGLGVEKLRGMTRLNELNLMHCDLQDRDLEIFLTTPNLRIVYAEGCPLTDFGVQSVIARFPMLAIFR